MKSAIQVLQREIAQTESVIEMMCNPGHLNHARAVERLSELRNAVAVLQNFQQPEQETQ